MPDEHADKHWWFHGASVAELYGRLGAANPSTCRLEVRLHGDKMTFRVVPEGVDRTTMTADGDVNDSHVCPPFCQ